MFRCSNDAFWILRQGVSFEYFCFSSIEKSTPIRFANHPVCLLVWNIWILSHIFQLVFSWSPKVGLLFKTDHVVLVFLSLELVRICFQEHIPVEEVFQQLRCSKEGLSDEEATARLAIFGHNKLEEKNV